MPRSDIDEAGSQASVTALRAADPTLARLIDGLAPDWPGLAYFTVFAVICVAFGYWWFAKTRKNFADVI